MAAATALVFVALLGIGIWLLSGTPGSLVNDEPVRMGSTPSPDAGAVVIIIEEGENAEDVGGKLADEGVIESARLFRVLASLMGVGDELEAGEYEFERGETALTAVRRISQGITSPLVVTIPEGLRFEEVAQLLEERDVVTADEFIRALRDQYEGSFLSELPAGASLQGFLFPATYGFTRDPSAHDVVQQMITAFDQRYTEDLEPTLEASGRTLYEIVTLAAIVEREAQVPRERPIIASVFVNRLAAGQALQADPTVQYAVALEPANVEQFGYWKQELSLADLALESPYNTYVTLGLPPGPIANPGLDSLLAAAAPADTNYLFFVARPDGSHAFAETLEEHNQNVCDVDPIRPEC